MSDEKERILKGLKQAIQSEVDGRNFYNMAAKNTQDEQGKAVFQSLAQDEVEHYIFLKAQYDSILKTGKVDLNIKLGKPSDTSESPIFSDDFKGKLKDAHGEMAALSVGAQLELLGIQFYRAEAEAAQDEDVKKFYNELADWEVTHHRRLLKQQQELQEDYWHDAGFAPF